MNELSLRQRLQFHVSKENRNSSAYNLNSKLYETAYFKIAVYFAIIGRRNAKQQPFDSKKIIRV